MGYFFAYGDLQKWLQMVLRCPPNIGLVSSASGPDPTSISSFLVDAVLLHMCCGSGFTMEFRDATVCGLCTLSCLLEGLRGRLHFAVRALSLASNRQLERPILRIYRDVSFIWHNPSYCMLTCTNMVVSRLLFFSIQPDWVTRIQKSNQGFFEMVQVN